MSRFLKPRNIALDGISQLLPDYLLCYIYRTVLLVFQQVKTLKLRTAKIKGFTVGRVDVCIGV